MAKKYGKNEFRLRGHIEYISDQPVGVDKVLLVKAYMNIPGREDKVMQVPVEAFGEAAQLIIDHNGEWIELEGRLEGREYEGKVYASNKVFEVKILPMHKESVDDPPSPPDKDDEDIPF